MDIIFLLLIYLAFISIGLPDTLLGSAWTVMQPELGTSLDAAGLITLIVSCCTIFSCLMNERLVRQLGTAKITALSGVITAAALLGYSQSHSYAWLLLFSIPLGLGAGSVDTCLNNYGALYLSTRHVSWMQCFYGLGATVGPALLSLNIKNGHTWHTGYLTISLIQFVIAAILVLTLPVWKGRDHKGEPLHSIAKNAEAEAGAAQKQKATLERRPLFLIPGVAIALVSYAVFFAIQYGTGLWAPSYLVGSRDFSPEAAARTVSLFYACVMIGRLVIGFISEKLSEKVLIRIGAGFCIAGAFLLGLRLPYAFYFIALACIGVGCAPIFPSMIHLTPARFGRRDSQRVMGVQMAAAYVGCVLITPLIGVFAERISVLTIPWFLLVLSILILCLSESVDRIVAKHPPKELLYKKQLEK